MASSSKTKKTNFYMSDTPRTDKDWLALPVWPPDSREKRESSREQHRAWMLLMVYCGVEQNGGRILSCRHWPAARWHEIVPDSSVLREDSLLWRWEGDDLVLNGYGGKFFNPSQV
jgi:hypothetical protein